MFLRLTMQLHFKKMDKEESIKMYIEDYYGQVEVLQVSNKNFGRD